MQYVNMKGAKRYKSLSQQPILKGYKQMPTAGEADSPSPIAPD
jgi:hypothetical protein